MWYIHTPTPGKAKGKQKFENNFKEMEKTKRPGPQNTFYSEKKKKKTQCWGINNIQDRLTQMGSP